MADDLKVSDAQLVSPRLKLTLQSFISAYIAGRNDATEDSKEIWRQGERSLYAFFGEDRNPKTITRTEAEDYKQYLFSQGRFDGKGGLAQSTVRKRIIQASMFFNAMVDRDHLSKNPFRGINVVATVDESRNGYVPREDVLYIMDYLPDVEWRLMVALSRFEGLRCPSEVFSLKWEHIQWVEGKILVPSPKTKRKGKSARLVPIFEDALPFLHEAFEKAKPGAVYVIEEHRGKIDVTFSWRDLNVNQIFRGYMHGTLE